jgi:uncharacterized membrane protein
VTVLAFVVHIAAGAVGLVSGMVVVIARKGGYLHRKAGTVFVASVVVTAVFAIYLGLQSPAKSQMCSLGPLSCTWS